MPNPYQTLGNAPITDDTDYLTEEIQFDIDSNMRTIAVPSEGVVIGVQGDKNVNRVNFRMPAWYNGFDMSTFQPRINFVDPEGNLNYYTVTDMKIYDPEGNEVTDTPTTEDIIYFTWLVDSYATNYVGTVVFNVRFTKFNPTTHALAQAFNTTKAACQVLEGITLADEITQEQQEDLLFHMTAELQDVTDSLKLDLDAKCAEVLETIPDNYTELGDEVSGLKSNLSQLRHEYVDNNKVNMRKFYEWPQTISTIPDDEYAIIPTFRVEAGTYYICNFSHYFSWFAYDDGEFKRFSEVLPSNVMNTEYDITFSEPATIYATLYSPLRFEPRFSNKHLNALSHYGYSEDSTDLIKSKPWVLGSWNWTEQNTNYFDTDFKYVTSFNMQFDKDTYIVNPDTSKYLYYVGYLENGGSSGWTDYNNNSILKIPANTLFRVGVKYTDNRILNRSTAHELIEKSIKIISNEYYILGSNNSSNGEAQTATIVNVGSTRTYTTIQAAINAITDASAYKRYIVLVDEGTYNITNAGIDYIPIKPYVTVKGVSKAKTIIRFEPETKDAYKNAFQQASSFNGYGEVCDFTIVTNNVKGALHLDDSSWQGEIYFHDIIAYSYGTEEEMNPNHDYYHNMDASLGTINLATHIGQKIVIENVSTNGYIYSHSNPSEFADMDENNGGTFIVKNCVCDWIGVYGNGEKVRKNAVLENNKCHFIKIAFLDNYGLGYMCWDVELVNNNTDFVAMQYFTQGSTTNRSLSYLYYSKNPFPDSNIHRIVENNSGSDISFGTKVNFTDKTKRYITAATGDTYDAVTTQAIGNGYMGVVQDGGDKTEYLTYLETHELLS